MGLGDIFNAVRDRWAALPRPLRWAATAGLAAGGLRVLHRASAVSLDADAIRHLPKLKGKTERKLDVARWLLDELQRDGTLNLDEIAALITIAYWETNLTPSAISADGLPDDAVGKSWGVIQLAAVTLQWLGIPINDVVAQDDSPAEWERATRASARASVLAMVRGRPRWAAPGSYLDGIRAMHREDPVALAVDIAVRWQAGDGRRWLDVMAVPPNPRIGSIGWMHFSVPQRIERLPDFRSALGLDPLRDQVRAWVASTAWPDQARYGVNLREW